MSPWSGNFGDQKVRKSKEQNNFVSDNRSKGIVRTSDAQLDLTMKMALFTMYAGQVDPGFFSGGKWGRWRELFWFGKSGRLLVHSYWQSESPDSMQTWFFPVQISPQGLQIKFRTVPNWGGQFTSLSLLWSGWGFLSRSGLVHFGLKLGDKRRVKMIWIPLAYLWAISIPLILLCFSYWYSWNG